MNAAKLSHRLCIAPMMNHTDRHFRYFLRLISRRVMLYTEMITTGAIVHGRQYQRLAFSEREHPLGLQLGGNDPGQLSYCARIAEDMGYDEINLNIGCPSDRVQNGRFGACLMLEPDLVAANVAAIAANSRIPVTVKTRIGVDDHDSYEYLHHFIKTVAAGGCHTFILHARKAWLEGLSPKQNREVPPLDYDRVYRLKHDFPDLEIIINGGVNTLEQALGHLERLDGVMIGRAVCKDPYLLATADELIFNDRTGTSDRAEILEQYSRYAGERLAEGTSLHQLTRHILGLFQGQPGARLWRRHLSENACLEKSGIQVIQDAINLMHAA